MTIRSVTKVKTFSDAIAANSIAVKTALGLFAHPSIKIPGPASAEWMSKADSTPALWDQYYWAVNSLPIDYDRILAILPEHGLMAEVVSGINISTCATFFKIDGHLVMDLIVPNEYKAIMRNTHRLIFVQVKDRFYCFDADGPVVRLHKDDRRDNPLQVIAKGYVETFCRWLGFCSEFNRPMEVTVAPNLRVKHTTKPRLKLKSNLEVNVAIDLELKANNDGFILPVISPSCKRLEDNAITTLTELIGNIAMGVEIDYWTKLRQSNSDLKAQYSTMVLDSREMASMIHHLPMPKVQP